MRFPLLLDADGYRPALWDLGRDETALAHWRQVFARQNESMLALVQEHRSADVWRRATSVGDQLMATLNQAGSAGVEWLEGNDHVHGWTVLRDEGLRAAGVEDPYRELKQLENRRALPLVDDCVRRLRATPRGGRLRRAVAAVRHGNRLDHGSPLTFEETGATDIAAFEVAVDRVEHERWLYDHIDRLEAVLESLEGPTVLVFVDNSGADFLCGVIPLAVTLASDHDATVVLAANQLPSLNDVTDTEARELLAEVARGSAAVRGVLNAGELQVVSTGTGSPGIDLREISGDLADVARVADLIVMIGQGRGFETNWHARLDVPTARIGTLKDPLVAATLGGQPFDGVCDVRAAGANAASRE